MTNNPNEREPLPGMLPTSHETEPPSPDTQPAADGDSRDAGGFQSWVEAYYSDVYRYAYRLTGEASAAEDVTQQAYLQAWNSRDQVASLSAVRGWLLAIARNTYLKSLRRQRPATFSKLGLDGEAMERVSCHETQADVAELLERLGEEQRTIVLMFYFERLAYREIAEQLGLPVGTVMSRLHRAKLALRELCERDEPRPGSSENQ